MSRGKERESSLHSTSSVGAMKVSGGFAAFVFLLCLRGSLLQTCPSAPSYITLPGNPPCGQSNLGREGALHISARQHDPASLTWYDRLWNGFLGVITRPFRQESPLIVNGSPATIEEAPFMVQMTNYFKNQAGGCSGSIIGSQWIVTAGHCIALNG
ncbi:unnamed protein product [Darwinula stevensoni]|uniref:Peptidase S1 domain-containing protein n=1 Tax=Darwinula stevensoni TaxID=69355 RepID=A0A7R9AC36_9CRUS|nr:unnamed protein product [Darwinula stevensoni]CAG0899617.1 unnamed protein product [Darwinula stevensoni]